MNRQPIENVVAETGKTIDAPPPEILETDPGLSPEEVEQIRRDYLLKRFWISAKGFWGAAGGRLAWVLTGGLLVLIILQLSFQYGINLWNRAIFDAIERRDADVVLHLTGVFFPLAIGSVLLGRNSGLHPHGHPEAMAGVADQFGYFPLVEERSLLPA